MKKWMQFLPVAVKNLRRGGQRIFVALMCIIFGVMSLVSMTLLANAVKQVTMIDARTENGGDLKVFPSETPFLSTEGLSELQSLQAQGQIDAYSLIAQNYTVAFHFPGSGELIFPGNALGIEPASYPLVGELPVQSPANTGLQTLLQEKGDVAVTRDLAKDYGLSLGDEIVLADLENGTPLQARIMGIIADRPNHQGSTMFYNLETATALLGSDSPVNQVVINTSQRESLTSRLVETGWRIYPAEQLAENNRKVADIIQTGLNGAGILGMLVGGIGIANTMQVLLSRRSKEIAVLKTLGYQQEDLYALFMLEALVLGLVGSLLGIALGSVLHGTMLRLFENTANFLFTAQIPLLPLATAFLVGVLTTMIFAMYAIVRSSNVRPAALLRNERILPGQIGRGKLVALLLALLVPFLLVTSFVMGSLLKGLGMLAVALAGLLVLGGFMAGIIWLVTRLIPATSFGLLKMARNNLKRRGFSLVFAMIALFVGVVALSLATVVVQNVQREMDERTIVLEGTNLTVIAGLEAEQDIQATLGQMGITPFDNGHLVAVSQIRVSQGENAGQVVGYNLFSRQQANDVQLSGQPWGEQPDGVYLYGYNHIAEGTQLEIVFRDGSSAMAKVAGYYEMEETNPTMMRMGGVLIADSTLQEMVKPDSTTYLLKVEPGKLNEIAAVLGDQLSNATIINHMNFMARFTQTYSNLYILALAMAGLALLAGTLLVANTVSLAMMERRYEIGVLKAVGYPRAKILTSLVFEYTFLALIASVLALLTVRGFVMVQAMMNEYAAALLRFTPSGIAMILLMGLSMPLAAVLAVTWQPTKVSPAVVLQDRI